MKKNIKIAIGYNPRVKMHSTNWSFPWKEYCESANINCDLIDCYQSDIINKLKQYDCFLWHFGNYDYQDMMMARNILYAASQLGIKVFPNFDTCWHFDDKIAETYLLQSINAPIPQSYIFYNYEDCKNWINNNVIHYPIVAKLRCGSGSHNVSLLNSKKEVLNYAKKMFGKGTSGTPSLFFKTKSNILSAKDKDTFIKRFKRAPEFLRTLKSARKFPREKEYVFFQEFIPNNGYDLKIVVVGDKLSFIGRHIRKSDFRASGGGDLFFDKSLISKNIIDSAFKTSEKLGFQCMGYDYVVNKNTGDGKIVEISYGFSHKALLEASSYFDKNGTWIQKPLNAPIEIIRNIMNDI